MFTLQHFIWLFISVVVIFLVSFLNRKFKISFNTNLTVLLIVCTISEIVKTIIGMNLKVNGGVYLDPINLPLHLCSIQLFFVYALKFFIKKEETKQKLLCFMFPSMLIGATLALLIPTSGVSFADVEVYRFFIFHMGLVAFSFYLITSNIVIIKWKTMFRNFAYLCVLSLMGIWANSILSDKGVNFFYLAYPPMEGLPLLNMNHGWYVYFLTLMILAIVLMSIVHIPCILIHNKKENRQKMQQVMDK